MDWKRFYADQINSPAGRAALLAAVQRHAGGDAVIEAALAAGGIASFPHVSILDSAGPLARIAQAVLALAPAQVLALGVLHGGTLPPAYQAAQAALHGGGAAARAAFAQLSGAFVARGAVATPFGEVADGPAPVLSAVLRDDAALLAQEFSLDLFLAVLAAAAQARGVPAPPVTRVFVSALRDPDGGWATATQLAAELRPLLGAGTLCVTTGDLVHIGHGYSRPEQVAGLPTDAATLRTQLLPQVVAMHEAALTQGDIERAWTLGSALGSDQRHLLALVAQLLGPGARAELLDFALSDYAAINGQPAPCFVAAALTVFRPALPNLSAAPAP
jgi:hypothetical protein